jgi:uncharacterized protein YuzE
MALEISYDQEVDVLYLSIRTAPAVDSTKERDGLLVDIDRQNGEVIGATVLDYEGKFRHLPNLSWVMSLHLPRPISSFLIDRTAAPRSEH